MKHGTLPDEAFDTTTTLVADNAEFFSALSHEFRTPLAVIKGYAQALSVRWDQLPDATRCLHLQRIMRSTMRLERLIGDLSIATRLVDGLLLRPSVVDVAGVVAEAIEDVRALHCTRPFEVVMPAAPLAIWADRERVMQILVNLLDNGAKYSPASRPITVRWFSDHPSVRLEVADNGLPLAPDDQSRLFQRYSRLRNARQAGSGLGLYICKGLAEAMDGQIGMYVSSNEGNIFWFDLPAHPC